MSLGRDLLSQGDTYLSHKRPISVILNKDCAYPCALGIEAVQYETSKHPREDLRRDLLGA